MNRLELVKRLSREAGVNQSGPSSTLNQTGEYLRLVDWIDTAYDNVQTTHATWQFLRKEFTLSLTAGVAEYAPSLIVDFAEWIDDDLRVYQQASDEQIIEYVPWELFRLGYLIGTQRNQTGRPSIFTIKPDETIVFFPIPNNSFTCKGEYYQTPDVMTNDASEPIFPVRFHLAILWRALMLYGAYSQEPDKYSVGQSEYKVAMRGLEKSQLPHITWGEPLA